MSITDDMESTICQKIVIIKNWPSKHPGSDQQLLDLKHTVSASIWQRHNTA